MDHQKHIYCLFVSFIIFSFSNLYLLPCSAQDRGQEPDTIKVKNYFEEYGEGKNAFLDFYQKWISPVKGGDKCPMYPSCSQYAKIAFRVLPWYKAYPASLERLLRCGHELYLYPAVRINDKIKFYDPISIQESKHRHKIPKDNLQSIYYNNNPKYGIPFIRNFSEEGFADYLFQEGEYDRAITEYYRLLYTTSDSVKKANLYKKIGLCYYHDANYQGYISFFNKNSSYFTANYILKAEMELYLGKSYYQLKNYQKAISTLEWKNDSLHQLLFNEKQLLLGISYARIFKWETAIEKLKLIQHDSIGAVSSKVFIRSLENFPRLPQRSPLLAGTLSSIIPGAGYLYCNRKGTGIASFIVNGLFIWTIRDAIVNEQYGLASTAGFLGIGWYIGNIKGSITAAGVYNTNVRNKFIDRLLEKENFFEYVEN